MPTTAGSYDPSWNGGYDVFLTKFIAAGSALGYSTFVGGSNEESAISIALDGASNAYVTGLAKGPGLPVTSGAYDTTNNDYDGFVTKLSASGASLAYSTYLGGSDVDAGAGIAVDSRGEAVVVGYTLSGDFPVASSANVDPSYNGGYDVTLTQLNDAGSHLLYSSYFGGGGRELGAGVAVDSQNNAYMTGSTGSGDFPVTPGAYDTTHNSSPQYDAFVTKVGLISPDAYARPKGATPARVSLVTANAQCTDPTITHGSPLAYPSCAGPALSSNFLTVGTGDSNARPAAMQASLRMDVQPGNPATPADDADVALRLVANDVFNKDLTDYGGELRGLLNVRITDKDSSVPAGNATTIDFPVGFTAGCIADPDPQIGSACDVSTTVDAVTPGAIKEGQRAIWALDKVRVFDGGPDGDADTAAGNTLFLTQGVFVP
jgi:hypothetical protein